jgi:hypothetical protein
MVLLDCVEPSYVNFPLSSRKCLSCEADWKLLVRDWVPSFLSCRGALFHSVTAIPELSWTIAVHLWCASSWYDSFRVLILSSIYLLQMQPYWPSWWLDAVAFENFQTHTSQAFLDHQKTQRLIPSSSSKMQRHGNSVIYGIGGKYFFHRFGKAKGRFCTN